MLTHHQAKCILWREAQRVCLKGRPHVQFRHGGPQPKASMGRSDIEGCSQTQPANKGCAISEVLLAIAGQICKPTMPIKSSDVVLLVAASGLIQLPQEQLCYNKSSSMSTNNKLRFLDSWPIFCDMHGNSQVKKPRKMPMRRCTFITPIHQRYSDHHFEALPL